MLIIALFMLAAFFGLKGIGAPDWAAVLGSVVVGEFLWWKERKRTAQEDHNTWLQQTTMSNALKLEMKLDELVIKLDRFSEEIGESNREQPSQTRPQLM